MGSMGLSDKELLENALDEAKDNYTRTHLASKKAHDESCLYMPGGNSRTSLYASPFPVTMESADSCYLRTIDGQEYVDFLGEFTAGIYGHNHPVIRQAVESALDDGWNYGGHSRAERELAKIICNRFPAMEMVRFTNSGTESNTLAVATALVVAAERGPSKKKVLVFRRAYHGAGMAISEKIPNINLPHEFVTGTFNDVDGTRELISSLPPNSLAAILVEPMIGSGGCYAASKQFLTTLRELATKEKALLIFDEIMTSRLAFHGFAATYGVTCDLMTLGKYLGGGMSFGAFGGREDIMNLYDPRTKRLEHPGTFNNNVFSMKAGVAGCKLLTHERLSELNDLGNDMRLRIESVLQKHQILEDGTIPFAPVTDESMHEESHPQKPPKMYIKGVGSLMCIHFAGGDRDSLQGLFYHHMLEQGIYIAQRGFIALSIEIKEYHIDKFVYAVDSFIRQFDPALRWQ